MANPCEPCSCIPYTDLCCCPPISGISVVQPACQTLPDGSVVNNPCFNSSTNHSTWTYKFFTDCATSTSPITSIAIPVCARIGQAQLVVEEQIDGCGTFTPVSFTLAATDPNFGTAPTGFQFLIVPVSGRFANGVSVIYRLNIVGDFPTAAQPIQVGTSAGVLNFNCSPGTCFVVPACPPVGNLVVDKICNENFSGNMVTLQFIDNVTNNGNATVNNVAYNDQIIYDATKITIGPVAVTPPTLTVNTAIPGIITVSGNLGNLAPGGSTSVIINVPIASVSAPGTYLITSNASVSGSGTQSSATCTLNLDVIQLATDKCCNVTGPNAGSFTITVASVGSSPQTIVEIRDTLIVPEGITVQFMSFGGCTATFTDGTPVPLNTNLTNRQINITCSPATVPAGGAFHAIIPFIVTSMVAFGTIPILNTFNKINLINPKPQLLISAGPLPVSATVNMVAALQCATPCV